MLKANRKSIINIIEILVVSLVVIIIAIVPVVLGTNNDNRILPKKRGETILFYDVHHDICGGVVEEIVEPPGDAELVFLVRSTGCLIEVNFNNVICSRK